MKNIILKLADLMDDIGHDKPDTNHVSAHGCSCLCPNVDVAVVSSDLLNFYFILFSLYYFISSATDTNFRGGQFANFIAAF